MGEEEKPIKAALALWLASVEDDLLKIAKKLADSKKLPTLGPTALLNEAIVRLLSSPDVKVNSLQHLRSLVVRTMRRVIVDDFRRRDAQKRGGSPRRVDLGALENIVNSPSSDPLTRMLLDEALIELERREPEASEAFVCSRNGLSLDEIAVMQGVTNSTVSRRLGTARGILAGLLARKGGPCDGSGGTSTN